MQSRKMCLSEMSDDSIDHECMLCMCYMSVWDVLYSVQCTQGSNVRETAEALGSSGPQAPHLTPVLCSPGGWTVRATVTDVNTGTWALVTNPGSSVTVSYSEQQVRLTLTPIPPTQNVMFIKC